MSNLTASTSPHQSSAKSYITGFTLALILTVVAFGAVEQNLASGYMLIGLLLGLALVQTIIQLWFFLHLGREEKPRWNAIFLLNTVGIILLIVIASIWIMNSLNYRMMTPEQMEEYAIEEGSKGF